MSAGGPPRLTHPPRQAEVEALHAGLRETAPAVEVELASGLHVWLIARYAEARAALRDPRLTPDPTRLPEGFPAFNGRRQPEDVLSVSGHHVFNTDGAEHLRLRGVLMEYLSASALDRHRAVIEDAVDRQLDVLAAAQAPDVLRHLAYPVPIEVIGRVVGVDKDLLPTLASSTLHVATAEEPQSSNVLDSLHAAYDTAAEAIARRRRVPGDDLISGALRTTAREGGLSLREIAGMVMIVALAGFTTTATLLGYGTAVLAERPDLVTLLGSGENGEGSGGTGGGGSDGSAGAGGSDGSGGGAGGSDTAVRVVEELLRHHPSIQCALWRFATEDVDVGGVRIPRGATVLISLIGANHDPRAFPEPEELAPSDPRRKQHLGFGHGPHYCVGAPLARMVSTATFSALFHRFPRIRPLLRVDELVWTDALIDRRITALPVDLGTTS